MSFQPYLDRYWPHVDAALRRALQVPQPLFTPFYQMMHYHMGWLDEQFKPEQAPQGKRLRPVLCLLACEAMGGDFERALPAAAAIELLHNFSLVHDDIEDNSDLRRHRTTVWKLWGRAHGINVGDAMFAHSFLTISRLQEAGVAALTALRAQRLFIETTIALTEGQFLDMDFETRAQVSAQEYLEMIRNKTAALIACSLQIGALVGGADEATAARFAGFGENVGLAFQVIDDILGIWGDETATGKSTSSDLATRKKTLPVIYALDDPDLQALYAYSVLNEAQVARAIDILERHRAREQAEAQAQRFVEHAKSYLVGLEVNPPLQAIIDLAQWLLGRTF